MKNDYSTEEKALNAAEIEGEYRGGKYEFEIISWKIDIGIEGSIKDYDFVKQLKPTRLKEN